jgi:hypothetical protein
MEQTKSEQEERDRIMKAADAAIRKMDRVVRAADDVLTILNRDGTETKVEHPFQAMQLADAVVNDKIDSLKKELAVAEQENYLLNGRLFKLTEAIDVFLNDTRDKQAVLILEQAMGDYGRRFRP